MIEAGQAAIQVRKFYSASGGVLRASDTQSEISDLVRSIQFHGARKKQRASWGRIKDAKGSNSFFRARRNFRQKILNPGAEKTGGDPTRILFSVSQGGKNLKNKLRLRKLQPSLFAQQVVGGRT